MAVKITDEQLDQMRHWLQGEKARCSAEFNGALDEIKTRDRELGEEGRRAKETREQLLPQVDALLDGKGLNRERARASIAYLRLLAKSHRLRQARVLGENVREYYGAK